MTQPLTDQQLADIDARASVATDGPWERYEKYGPDFFACTSGSYLRGVGTFNFGDGTDADADEEFVKHAVQDVRTLVAEVRRQREQIRLLLDAAARKDAASGAGDRALREFLGSEPTDTLPAWLYQRFMPHGIGWDQLDTDDRAYWEHQAAAVRRAVARGGFKTSPAAVPAVVREGA